MGEGGTTLEYTPTWVVAVVCTVIVAISLAVERLLHYLGKACLIFSRERTRNLFLKPYRRSKKCVKTQLPKSAYLNIYPPNGCLARNNKTTKLKRLLTFSPSFLLMASTATFSPRPPPPPPPPPPPLKLTVLKRPVVIDLNIRQGEAALISTTALHHLHIFIFVLAVAHVTFCALTILFGGAKIRQWKHWEESVSKDRIDAQEFTHVQDHDFIKNRFRGVGKSFGLQSFCKQFYGSVTKTDYTTLRLSFIMNHCRGNPKFDFHKYMMRVFEADFKKVVGIRLLLLAVGTKLEHVITQLAHEVAETHVAIEGDLVVKPSDDHFWFKRPRLILLLIHIILFQNSFELAVFFWIWMGSSFKKQVFDEHIQTGLVGWAKQAKKNTVLRKAAAANGNSNGSSSQVSHKEDSPLMALQLPTLAGDKGSSAIYGRRDCA
ncbi:hypothetical protein LWI28_025451 [Acer negundo]|uniref:MLO-like protein n=1 Tax=Acer negundo TaxID=4023 RepID=A0AAD5IEB3_ACENE|nr:hypothetical protein LWI28_025451 [Acer negundo]